MYYYRYDLRSITNVNEVAENIFKLFEFPSGSYNFAATGNYGQYDIAHGVIRGLYPDNPKVWELIQVNENSTLKNARNITMDMSKISSYGIHFEDSIQSILNLVK
ncbi:MAG: hypothetical protein R3Y40_02980 [Eubacteriales bacterium]